MISEPAPEGLPGGAPTVDVVIATHNRPALLRVALDAVLAQTYSGHIRCTLVFDRSDPDYSLERDDPSRSVRVVANQRTAGLAGARNTGVLSGAGDYIAFCDDDDEWLPTKVERQVALMARSSALVCVTGIVVVYEDREVSRVPVAADVTLQSLVRNRTMEAHPSTVMVRRSAMVGQIGLVDEGIPGSYGEDYEWIVRAAETGSIAVVEDALVRVLWGQSLFSTKWQTIVDSIDYQIAKQPVFSSDRRGLARQLGRKSFALASLGKKSEALKTAGSSLRRSLGDKRAYAAIAVALGVVSSERLMQMAHRHGRGI